MKILHLIAPIAFGGGESLLYNLLKEKFNDCREGIALIYNSPMFISKLNEVDVPYYKLRNKEIGQAVSKMQAFFQTFINIFLVVKLLSIIKNENYTHIHAHGYPSIVIAIMVKIFCKKIKVIYTHHSYRASPKNKLEKRIFEIMYNKCDIVTGVSDTVSKSLEVAFNLHKKVRTVHNCISKDFFSETPRVPSFIDLDDKIRSKKSFIQVARFTKIKNHLLIVNAIHELSQEKDSNIIVLFVGSGPELDTIKKLVLRYDLNEYFIFLGMIEYSKIPEIISICDYGLFPSDVEGFGLGAVECMAKGLPVLAQDNSLMREIVAGNGLLVPKSSFAQGFKLIMDMDFNPVDIAKSTYKYHPNRVKGEYIKLYQEN